MTLLEDLLDNQLESRLSGDRSCAASSGVDCNGVGALGRSPSLAAEGIAAAARCEPDGGDSQDHNQPDPLTQLQEKFVQE